MGRLPRQYAEGIYHVAAHGSDDRVLFHDDNDRRAFLAHLETTFALLELEVVSFVLMTNHHHLIVATPDARLELGLQQLHGGYSRIHNRRHGRTAHLFRAHSFARRIEDDDDLKWTDRYIARNPLEAGIVTDPLDHYWSSAPAHAGMSRPLIRLHEAPLRAAYDNVPDWRRRYVETVLGTGARRAA
jgi:REP element-mobilizing transposase RayT